MSTWARVRRVPAVVVAACVVLGGTSEVAAGLPTGTDAPASDLYLVALSARSVDQDALLQDLGRPEVLYRYRAALDGFAARLTRDQVKRLRADPDVALVERSTKQHLDSTDSRRSIGADEAWAAAGGPDAAGRGRVVGVVDSGIWPENPSFAALPGVDDRGPAGFRGSCARGDQWDGADCNSKVVSARWFVKGFGEENLAATEFLSPRDGSGHGSHTAAVAAGNDRVRVRVEGQDFGWSAGMAPGARVAVYKACWTAPDPSDDGCTTADAVAAIDQAVADGVDVISYAVSGPSGVDSDAVELAFLNATAKGVFVAASAGNGGPGRGTVAHASPWVTTVGANSHHTFQGGVVLGGDVHVGAMVSDRVVRRTGIVLGEDAARADGSRDDARLCLPDALDASKVRGRIVVCDRGTIARVEKSSAVAGAGGVGMVLANVRPEGVYADFHEVPTVHLDVEAAAAVKRYVSRSAHPTAAIDPRANSGDDRPQVAPFSARGPARRDRGGLLKPDVTAPGVSVLSAVAPASDEGRLWDQYSGTSTSTAHVAGLAALVMGEHPRWTPAMVKSALSTTADPLDGSGPLAAGAGQVDASDVLDPGLVLDAPAHRFRAWLAGRVETRGLNLPSIAVGDLTAPTRVVRHVTNVSGGTETYSARVRGLTGLDVRVRPSTLRLGPGETGRFTVDLARGTAGLESPARGYLLWTSTTHQLRMPMAVTPRRVSAPQEATVSGSSGSLSFQGLSAAGGRLGLRLSGLVPAEPTGLVLEPGGFEPRHPVVDEDTARFPVDVPADAKALRIALEGRESDDLDLHLFRDGRLVASATGSGAGEMITRLDPAPGRYELYVSSVVAGNGATTTAQLYTWVLGPGDERNLAAPGSVDVSAGGPFHVRLRWKGLDPTARWFGQLRYAGSDERTFVTVN